MARGQEPKSEHYEELEDYDYNNPNDISNFCPGLQVKCRGTAASLLPSSRSWGTFCIRWEFCGYRVGPQSGKLSRAELPVSALACLTTSPVSRKQMDTLQ